MSSYLADARRRLAALRAAAPRVANSEELLRINEGNEVTPLESAPEVLRSNEGNEVSRLDAAERRHCIVCGDPIACGLWYFCGGACANRWEPAGEPPSGEPPARDTQPCPRCRAPLDAWRACTESRLRLCACGESTNYYAIACPTCVASRHARLEAAPARLRPREAQADDSRLHPCPGCAAQGTRKLIPTCWATCAVCRSAAVEFERTNEEAA
jgi:hypothetical protein